MLFTELTERGAIRPVTFTDLLRLERQGRFKITELPKPVPSKSANAKTPALLHPDMPIYFKIMKKLGYELHIDPTLKFIGAGGVHSPHAKIIAIKPQSTWQTFIHEFQHLQFSQLLQKDFSKIQSQVQSGKKLKNILPRKTLKSLGPRKTKLLQKSLKKGHQQIGINEMMSVSDELALLGFKPYQIYTKSEAIEAGAHHSYGYALKHQLKSLNRLTESGQKLTPKQKLTYLQTRLSLTGANNAYIIQNAPYIVVSTAGGIAAANAIYQDNEKAFEHAAEYFFDPETGVFITFIDGVINIGYLPEPPP